MHLHWRHGVHSAHGVQPRGVPSRSAGEEGAACAGRRVTIWASSRERVTVGLGDANRPSIVRSVRYVCEMCAICTCVTCVLRVRYVCATCTCAMSSWWSDLLAQRAASCGAQRSRATRSRCASLRARARHRARARLTSRRLSALCLVCAGVPCPVWQNEVELEAGGSRVRARRYITYKNLV